MRLGLPLLVCFVCSACVGTTGSSLVTFQAYARGPRAVRDHSYAFDSGRGFHVTLSKANVHVGAVYLNHSSPTSGSQATSCVLPGIYVGEVTNGGDVDVLSSVPQPIGFGEGTAEHASAAEVWFTAADVNREDDATIIADVAGVATKGSDTFPFVGTVTIGRNRAIPPPDVTQPGANPICKQRIVSPIPINLALRDGVPLVLEIDPKGWFANVDFSALVPTSTTPPSFAFTDTNDDAPSRSLFVGLRSSDAYRFSIGTP